MADFSTDLVSELSDVTDILDVLHKPKYKVWTNALVTLFSSR